MCTLPAKIKQDNALPSSVCFHCLCSTMFFTFLCSVFVIWLSKMVPKLPAKVLSSAPKHKKAAMCFTEKTRVLDTHPSSRSHSAVGCEFSVNDSTT